MKCNMMSLQTEIRLSYLKLVRNYEADGIFGLSSNLTAVAKTLKKFKFLIPITMERSSEISSSEDEFDLELLNEEITAIHRELDDRENRSSDYDSDEVRGVRSRKIRVIDSEGDSNSDAAEDPRSDSSEWLKKENAEVAPFPPKRVRNCQPKVLEQRRAALELYTHKMLRLSATKQQVLNFLGIESRTATASYKSTYKVPENTQYDHPNTLGHHPVLTFHCDTYAQSNSSSSLPDIVIDGVLQGMYEF